MAYAIRTYGDPVLKTKAAEITDVDGKLVRLVNDMIVGADDDSSFVFQCIEIADGTRDIDVGQAVSFRLLPRFGAFQAGAIEKR